MGPLGRGGGAPVLAAAPAALAPVSALKAPVSALKKDRSKDGSRTVCSVCLENYVAGDKVRLACCACGCFSMHVGPCLCLSCEVKRATMSRLWLRLWLHVPLPVCTLLGLRWLAQLYSLTLHVMQLKLAVYRIA